MAGAATEYQNVIDSIGERTSRRREIIWSAWSITGYVWDIVRNIVVTFIVLLLYASVYDYENIIIVSVGILTYLAVLNTTAGIGQVLIRTNLQMHSQFTDTLKRLGQEQSEDDAIDFENAGYMVEKMQYKFFINAGFNLILFIIVIFNLLGAID